MDIKKFVLTYYKNSSKDFHVQKLCSVNEAQKPHTHDYFQIYYVKKGGLKHFVNSKSSLLTSGDIFIVPPDEIHYVKPEKDTVFYVFSFMPDFLKGANPLISGIFSEMKKGDLRPKVTLKSNDIVFVETVIERIYKDFNEKPFGFTHTISAGASILVTLIARYYFEEENASLFFENNKDFVLLCVEYIKNNFSEDITLEKMTKRSMMSKNSFCKIFRNITGYTFKEYLNVCRIKKSAELIKSGEKISTAAELCGYNDFSTFYRNFVKIMGVSPSKYI